MTITLSDDDIDLIKNLIEFAELNEFFHSDGSDTARCAEAALIAAHLKRRLNIDDLDVEYS